MIAKKAMMVQIIIPHLASKDELMNPKSYCFSLTPNDATETQGCCLLHDKTLKEWFRELKSSRLGSSSFRVTLGRKMAIISDEDRLRNFFLSLLDRQLEPKDRHDRLKPHHVIGRDLNEQRTAKRAIVSGRFKCN